MKRLPGWGVGPAALSSSRLSSNISLKGRMSHKMTSCPFLKLGDFPLRARLQFARSGSLSGLQGLSNPCARAPSEYMNHRRDIL